VIKASRPDDIDSGERKGVNHGICRKKYDSSRKKNRKYAPAQRAHHETASLFKSTAQIYIKIHRRL
jgi:hypothetical protein